MENHLIGLVRVEFRVADMYGLILIPLRCELVKQNVHSLKIYIFVRVKIFSRLIVFYMYKTFFTGIIVCFSFFYEYK